MNRGKWEIYRQFSDGSDQLSPPGGSKNPSALFLEQIVPQAEKKKEKCGQAHTCELLPQQILLNLAGLQISPSLILTNIFYFSHCTTIILHNELISKHSESEQSPSVF